MLAFEVTAPTIALTRCRFTRRFAAFAASVGSFLSSWITVTIFIPATPPFALASSTAMRKEFFTDSPNVFTSPESGVISPILMSFACAGAAARHVPNRIDARTADTRFIVPPSARTAEPGRS